MLQGEHSVAALGQRAVVGHQYQGGAVLTVEGEQLLDNGFAGGRVEIAGGLIGKQQLRLHRKGAGQGHALLFAAGQLRGVMAQPLAQADGVERRGGRLAGLAVTSKLQRQHDVFERCKAAQQLERLEHETHLAGACGGASVFVQGVDALTAQPNLSRRRGVQAGQQRQQRGLARAGTADDGHALAVGNGEVELVQNAQRLTAAGHFMS